MPFARQSSSLSAPTPSTETSPSALPYLSAEFVDMTKEYDVWGKVPKSMLLNMIMNPW